jgi:transposase
MKLEKIDITATVEETEKLIDKDKGISPALKASLKILLIVVKLLVERLGLNSSNSSIPPSQDPNRKKKDKGKRDKKPGGQKGHKAHIIQKVENPDIIEDIQIDFSKLPKGKYTDAGFESRQVIEIEISRVVTEYRAQMVQDKAGCFYVAEFPKGISRPVQYGMSVKAHAIYLSQYQLIPYSRVEEHFDDWLNIPISKGSIYNFNLEAFRKLELFEKILQLQLTESEFLHVDETGINIGGKGHWLHCISNLFWTYYYPHKKRGGEAMDEMGILPKFKGLLCHDHWKPYYKYDCTHCLCNAHHLRELQRASEMDKQEWAVKMKQLLLEASQAVIKAGGKLKPKEVENFRMRYRKILEVAEIECPPPDERQRKKAQRGRIKRSKSRNLFERLRNFEDDVLRFMEFEIVTFTNNQGERDIRMMKVQQKISGCFRSMRGAEIHSRIKSYLSTCLKNGVGSREALEQLYRGKLPAFIIRAQKNLIELN